MNKFPFRQVKSNSEASHVLTSEGNYLMNIRLLIKIKNRSVGALIVYDVTKKESFEGLS